MLLIIVEKTLLNIFICVPRFQQKRGIGGDGEGKNAVFALQAPIFEFFCVVPMMFSFGNLAWASSDSAFFQPAAFFQPGGWTPPPPGGGR